MQTSIGMLNDATEHQDTRRILQVKASSRTGSADAKQVDFGAGSACIHPMQELQTYWCYWGGKWWGGGMYPLGLYVRLPQTGVFPRAFPSSSQCTVSLL